MHTLVFPLENYPQDRLVNVHTVNLDTMASGVRYVCPCCGKQPPARRDAPATHVCTGCGAQLDNIRRSDVYLPNIEAYQEYQRRVKQRDLAREIDSILTRYADIMPAVVAEYGKRKSHEAFERWRTHDDTLDAVRVPPNPAFAKLSSRRNPADGGKCFCRARCEACGAAYRKEEGHTCAR